MADSEFHIVNQSQGQGGKSKNVLAVIIVSRVLGRRSWYFLLVIAVYVEAALTFES
jgi:uncharacterized protein involved in exopolysaccharide biosynthesis